MTWQADIAEAFGDVVRNYLSTHTGLLRLAAIDTSSIVERAIKSYLNIEKNITIPIRTSIQYILDNHSEILRIDNSMLTYIKSCIYMRNHIIHELYVPERDSVRAFIKVAASFLDNIGVDISEHTIILEQEGCLEDEIVCIVNKIPGKDLESVNIGDIIVAGVLSVDKDKKRIALDIKQLKPNPWVSADKRYLVGREVEGEVRSLNDFGAFIALEAGIDGLIHISDMSWSCRGFKRPSEILKMGQRVRAAVLHVDKENERLSLGLKQMELDPWTQVQTKYNVGQDVRVKVVKVTNFGVFAELEYGVEGLIHLSELSREKVADPEDVVSVGQELEAKIIKIDIETRKIVLSVRAIAETEANERKLRL